MMMFFWVWDATLEMEIVRFSETLASISQSTRRQNPKEHHYYINKTLKISKICTESRHCEWW
jgi:hypothetical protein